MCIEYLNNLLYNILVSKHTMNFVSLRTGYAAEMTDSEFESGYGLGS